MKQLILCLSMLCLWQIAQAQNTKRFDEQEYKSALKFNLLSPIVGAIAVNYENSLNNDASFIASAS